VAVVAAVGETDMVEVEVEVDTAEDTVVQDAVTARVLLVAEAEAMMTVGLLDTMRIAATVVRDTTTATGTAVIVVKKDVAMTESLGGTGNQHLRLLGNSG
jgi:hypothetical protein